MKRIVVRYSSIFGRQLESEGPEHSSELLSEAPVCNDINLSAYGVVFTQLLSGFTRPRATSYASSWSTVPFRQCLSYTYN